jgi:hypothetical protein
MGKYYSILFIVLLLSACIDPYNADLEAPERGLTVEAVITTLPGPQEVKLTRNAPYGLSFVGFNRPEILAKVALRDDLGRTFVFTESQDSNRPGVYISDQDFSAEVGRTYNLELELFSGKRYISRPETVAEVPKVDSLTYKSVRTATTNKYIGEVGVQVTAHFQDPKGIENFYHWRPITSTFVLITEPDAEGGRNPPVSCCARCFHTDFPQPANVITYDDKDVDGLYQRKIVAYILDDGVRFKETYRLDFLHLGISQRAHSFLRLVNQQLSLTGSVFDPPPANIRGNMISLDDPNEQVLGYFLVADAEFMRVYIHKDRLEFVKTPFTKIFLDCREFLRAQDGLGRNPIRPPLLPLDPPDDWNP